MANQVRHKKTLIFADPFFTIHKAGNLLWKSNVIAKSTDPVWESFVLDLSVVHWNDTIEFKFYDFDEDGSNDFAGSVAVKLSEFAFDTYQGAIVDANRSS